MSLIACPSCTADVAATAKTCPHCGGRTAAADEAFLALRGYAIGTGLLVALVVLILYLNLWA